MKCWLYVLPLLACVTAVLYYYIVQLERNETFVYKTSALEHLKPSFDKHYILFKQDKNINKVMRSVGVNPMNVHLGHSVPDTVVLKVEEMETHLFTLTQYYSINEVKLRFRLGQEFEETCVHSGVTVRSVITQYRNNLTHVQFREGIRHPMITRRVFRSEELVVEMRVGNIVSTLVYFPVNEKK